MIIEMFSPARFSMNLNFPIGHKSVAGLWTIISFHSEIVTPQVSAASLLRTQLLSVWVAFVLLPTSNPQIQGRDKANVTFGVVHQKHGCVHHEQRRGSQILLDGNVDLPWIYLNQENYWLSLGYLLQWIWPKVVLASFVSDPYYARSL